MYGPWVQDLDHGGRPEIHPCEVIWWRDGSFDAIGPHPHVRWTLVVLQDDSNRFDRYANYDGVPGRPWSQSPRRAHITMSLQAPRGERSLYNISVSEGLRIFEHPGEETPSVTRDYEGRSVLTVSKRMSRPAQVKVRLSELSPDPSNRNKLRCFLDIDVQVGEGDRGKEGFAELSIEHFVPVPVAAIKTLIDLNGRWASGGTPGPVISTAPTTLTIDMSAYNRPSADGSIIDASTISVTFPDDATYTGKLQLPNRIQWSNGSAWTKV